MDGFMNEATGSKGEPCMTWCYFWFKDKLGHMVDSNNTKPEQEDVHPHTDTYPCLICSLRSHGRLTCNTWRAWSTRGHPVWLLPIHPTRVAQSSAGNTYRRSSKVSCTFAELSFSRNSFNWHHSSKHLLHLGETMKQVYSCFFSGLQTMCSHPGRWNLQWYGECNSTATQVTSEYRLAGVLGPL